MLEVVDLSIERDNKRIFQNLTFSLQSHQVVHVIGGNGSGKTTLLRALSTLLSAETGQIIFQSRPIGEDLLDYLRNFAYVGHENGLKGELTPLENLRFEQSLGAGKSSVSLLELLRKLNISHCSNVPCRYLSAGQKRLVALTRLLVSDAKLWLLDEPLTGLDTDARKLFTAMLAEHLDAGGAAVVTSHQKFDWKTIEVVQVQLSDYRNE